MKMETSIVANQDGVIDKIYVKEGEQVNQGRFAGFLRTGGLIFFSRYKNNEAKAQSFMGCAFFMG